MSYESYVSLKSTPDTTYGELGIQKPSYQPRGVEVSAFHGEALCSPPSDLQSAIQTVALHDQIALDPLSIRGRVGGVKRKPPTGIVDASARALWVSQSCGFSEPFVWSALRTLDLMRLIS